MNCPLGWFFFCGEWCVFVVGGYTAGFGGNKFLTADKIFERRISLSFIAFKKRLAVFSH
jgi:hypothetical protein